MLPTVFRDHLSMLIMLLLLMAKENFLDMKVYEEEDIYNNNVIFKYIRRFSVESSSEQKIGNNNNHSG